MVKVPNNPSTFDNRILSSKLELKLRERSWIEVVQLSKSKTTFIHFCSSFLALNSPVVRRRQKISAVERQVLVLL